MEKMNNPEESVHGIPRTLIDKALTLTAVVALTAVVLKYTMPVVSDLIYTRGV